MDLITSSEEKGETITMVEGIWVSDNRHESVSSEYSGPLLVEGEDEV